MGQLPILFKNKKNKRTHIQGRGKRVLTQMHTTTPLKSHGKNNSVNVLIHDNFRAE